MTQPSLNPQRIESIIDTIKEALALLLDYLHKTGIDDWAERYSGIDELLEMGNYEKVVEIVQANSKTVIEADESMDLVCHYLDKAPPHEIERLEKGRQKYGKYIDASFFAMQLRQATDVLRIYIAYGIYNEPINVRKCNYII